MIEIVNNLSPDCMEFDYISEIMEHLQSKLSGDWSLVATSFFGENYSVVDRLPETKHNKIAFVTSDEWNGPLPYVDDPTLALVFKTCLPDFQKHPKVKPLPLGVYKGFNIDSYKPITDRKYDFSFNGQVNSPERHLMVKQLDSYAALSFRPHFLRYTQAFAEGPIEEYSKIMCNSKIALNPSGGSGATVDSSRYFEAMMAGCVVMTSPRPHTIFYDGSPHIVVDNWEQAGYIIEETLRDKSRLKYLSKLSSGWWENICSPEPISNYVVDTVNERL